jgi:hypothetical protein
MHVFAAEGVEEGEASQQEDEEIELVRIPLSELEARMDEFEDAKTIAGLHVYLRQRAR